MNVGDVLIDPDGRVLVVERVYRTEDVKSSPFIGGRKFERSAIHCEPDLERKQAQQAPKEHTA